MGHTRPVPLPDPSFQAVSERLAAAGCVSPDQEVAEILADAPVASVLEERVARRERGEPLAWITGWTTFCGRRLRVDPGVYVPRVQTEELARRATDLLPPGGRALDLCTGAGAVADHLRVSVPGAAVAGVDLDEVAVACARRNHVPVLVGDLAEPVRPGRLFDLITAVAPYVPTDELTLLPSDVVRYEPGLALAGGDDGLEVVRRIVVAAADRLRPGGWLVLELGGDQDARLEPTLIECGFGLISPWRDEEGDLRGLAAQVAPR
jgi:release factor glutamine methyltransferase